MIVINVRNNFAEYISGIQPNANDNVDIIPTLNSAVVKDSLKLFIVLIEYNHVWIVYCGYVTTAYWCRL